MRPSVALEQRDLVLGRPIEALAAQWVTDDLEVRVPFDQAVFFAGPFPFVWTKAGAIFRVAPDVDALLANQLVKAPVLQIPLGKLREAGSELHRALRGRGVSLPPPKSWAPRNRDAADRASACGWPFSRGELVAVYRAREVGLALLGEPLGEDALQEGRDLECEARARTLVERAGFTFTPLEGDDDDAHRHLACRHAVAFWREGIAFLRAAQNPRVEIHLTKRLAQVRIGAPLKSRLQVVLEGDWLKAQLKFSSKILRSSSPRCAVRWIAKSAGCG